VNAIQEFGDVEWGAGLLKYVIGHLYLRKTFTRDGAGGAPVSLTEAADGAELGVQGCFEYG
jgi:hypothetical protein